MSEVHTRIKEYVLGNSAQELERLKLPGGFLEEWTEQFLRGAGLESEMRVLGVGCGMGDVSLLAVKLVGPSGHVTAIDRDPIVIEKARERSRGECRNANVEFIHTELVDFHAKREFDAVVGRYVLFFQPDPVAAIAHAARQVRPEGIIVFHELDLTNRIRSCPNETLFDRMWTLIAETERQAGVSLDSGLQLAHAVLGAGLPWPTIKAEVPVGGEPGSFIYRWVAELLRSLLRTLSNLVWPAPTNWISMRLWREWRTRQSPSEFNFSARFNLGLGPEILPFKTRIKEKSNKYAEDKARTT